MSGAVAAVLNYLKYVKVMSSFIFTVNTWIFIGLLITTCILFYPFTICSSAPLHLNAVAKKGRANVSMTVNIKCIKTLDISTNTDAETQTRDETELKSIHILFTATRFAYTSHIYDKVHSKKE